MGVKTDAIVFLAGGVDAINSVGNGNAGGGSAAQTRTSTDCFGNMCPRRDGWKPSPTRKLR